jgi:hypothetical protein
LDKKCNWHGTEPIGLEQNQSVGVPIEDVNKLHERITSGKIRRYVITSAQNATPIWAPFFKSLLSYCQHNNAQLVVVPYRYKNPTSTWSGKAQSDDWWASELAPYLYDRRVELCENLTLLADIKAQPTGEQPLRGFETLTGPRSGIVGHPKLSLLTVPTPQQRLPKILVTTGSVTKKNYIPSKAGKKGEHHHTFGACLVEIGESGAFFIRQLNAIRNGSFCDLEYEYSHKRQPKKIRAAALVMGDTHVDFADPDAVKALFGEGGIVNTLRPRVLVWHDVLDFYSRMHHHNGEVFTNYAKHHAGRDNVERELDACFRFIEKYSPAYTQNVFVYSNHPDMMARWIKGTDPRNDPENCVFWARTFEAMCQGTQLTDTGTVTIDPFAWWAKRKLRCYRRSRFLAPDESYQVRGIEMGYHGHAGPGGARGSLAAFTKIGTKVAIGHSHTPGINGGAYQVGTTSRLKLEFMRGPNSSLHAHCAVYHNGKRSLIISIKDKWRLPNGR